jgi:hypothetical protein
LKRDEKPVTKAEIDDVISRLRDAISHARDVEDQMSMAAQAYPVMFFLLTPLLLPLWAALKGMEGILRIVRKLLEKAR